MANNIFSTTPKLSERERLGGVNFVILPHWDSPAVGAGDPNPGKLSDQRGYDPEGAPDIGAAQFIENFVIDTNFGDDWQTWSRSRIGAPSIRDAVVILNEQGGNGTKTISLVEGTYQLEVPDTASDDRFGSLDLYTNINIVGAGAGASIIDGSAIDDRVFYVRDEGNLNLTNLTVTGGHTGSDGGGILNRGMLNLSEVIVSQNTAVRGGGGISTSNTGTTTIVNSAIDDNLAWMGGGLMVRGGSLVVDSSTVSNNNAEGQSGVAGLRNSGGGGGAAGFGGAMAVFGGGTVEFRRSTVSNNAAIGGDGGGVSGGEALLDSVHQVTDGFNISGHMGGTGGGPDAPQGGWWVGADGSSGGSILETYRVNAGSNVTDFGTGAGGGSGVPIRKAGALAVHTTDEITTGGSAFGGGGGGGGGAGATGVSNYCAVVPNCNSSWTGGGGTYQGGTATGFGAGAGGEGTPTMAGGGGGGAAAGGGLFVYSGSVSIRSSTITENTVHGGAGGRGLAGTEANPGEDAVGSGGGAYVFGEGNLSLENSIMAGNTADEGGLPDVAGWMTDNGWNLVSVDPELGSLSDNGGFGMTHVPTADSPALDAGSSPFTFDQRQQVNGVGPQDDIGAIESHELIVSSFEDVSSERSLRRALIDAASLPGHNVIELLPGSYTLDAPLTIDSDVTIKGAGAGSTTIDGSAVTSDLLLVEGFEVTLAGLTIEGPETGRILDLKSGEARVVESQLNGGENGVPAGWPTRDGGLILASSNSVLTISSSTLTGGKAHGRGGAIALRGSSETVIESSTIYGSSSNGDGDAIFMASTASLTLTQSTVAGGVENYNGVSVVKNATNTITLHNSIIEGKLVGGVTSMGHNLVGDASAASGLVAEDIVNADPMLEELADNGGPTMSVRPMTGSPAVDAGEDVGGESDQRGSVRVLGDAIDIGAVEREELSVTRTTDDTEPGSLRRAILDANQLPWAAKIEIEAGTYVLDVSGADQTGHTGDLDIIGDLTISGEGVGETIIDISGLGDRAFDVMGDASLGLSNLKLQGGNAVVGGAIRNAGSLALTTVEVANSQANNGGAIANLVGGELSILSSLLRDNSATNAGGAIDNRGEATVRHTTFSGNAGKNGGGFYNRPTGDALLTNTTIAENTATESGAGVASLTGGYVELLNTLIVDNSTDVSGHFVANSTVVGNIGSATGFAESEESGGNTYATGSEFIDAELGTLRNNGGETFTYRPAATSLLIDAGLDQVEEGIDPETNQIVTTKFVRDQRGFTRDQRSDPGAEHATDIGAVEAQFDFVQTIEEDSTVFVRSAGAGLTEIVEDGESTQFANPYRSLTIGTVNAQDTRERIEIESLAGDFEVKVHRYRLEGEERTKLPGAVKFFGGAVTVNGTSGSDVSTMRVAGDQYKLDVDLAGDPIQVLFNLDDVTGVLMTAGGGDDDLNVISSVQIPVTLVGGNGNDTLRGAAGDDLLRGNAGDDSILGRGGNDTLLGAGGDDSLTGGDGNDSITDQSGHNLVSAGDGDDTVTTGWGRDTIYGHAGHDRVNSGGAADEIRTGSGKDRIVSGSGNDSITSGSGADDIKAGSGRDLVNAGDGSDIVRGGNNADTVNAGRGSDTVLGNDGADSLRGESGKDVLVGGAGADVLRGEADRDLLIGGLESDTLSGSSGEDILVSGATDHDANISSLDSILAEWAASRDYETRVANLRGGSPGVPRLNGDNFLIANVTVAEDNASDQLFGGADRDWFFAGLAGGNQDAFNRVDENEFVDELLN